MIDLAVAVLMVVGMFFLFVGVLGVFRFEDVFLRLQAASKSLTMGFAGIILAMGLASGDHATFLKAVVAVAFQFLTAPLAAQMIARAALHRGIVPTKMDRE